MVNRVGTAGNDTLLGTENNDTLQGLDGNDILQGLGRVDFLYGGAGDDRLEGGSGNDHLDGGAGNDSIYASEYNPILGVIGTSTADWIDGGSGIDGLYVRLATSGGVGGVVLITNTDPGGVTHASNGLTFRNIEGVFVTGTDWADRIDGSDGNDRLTGGSGNDHLVGGAGDDIIGAGDETGWDGPGADSDGSLADWIDGGDGEDGLVVHLATSSGAGGVVLIANADPGGTTHASNGLTFRNIEKLHITGTDRADRIDGGNGNDSISGGGGSHIFGRGGDDHLSLTDDGGALIGGDGNDQLFSSYYISSDVGGARLQGGAGDDHLYSGAGSDRLDGDAGDDTLMGRAGVDHLYGGDGSDMLFGDGEVGHDPLSYAEEVYNDILQGGAGNDVLVGGAGKDTLAGGAGADHFAYFGMDSLPGAGSRDVITDFSQAEGDRIDLSGYVVGTPNVDPNLDLPDPVHFTFIGTGGFTGTGPTVDFTGLIDHYNGQVNYRYDGANTVLSGDIDGDKVADLEIVVFGHITPKAGDFIF